MNSDIEEMTKKYIKICDECLEDYIDKLSLIGLPIEALPAANLFMASLLIKSIISLNIESKDNTKTFLELKEECFKRISNLIK